MNRFVLKISISLASCLIILSGLAVSSTAHAQEHAGHTMQSMAEEGTGTAQSKDMQDKQGEPVQAVPQVEITPQQQQLIGVKTAMVSLNPFKKMIRTVGMIEVDERKTATVNAKIEGWIEKLYVDYTGAYVKKGEPLAEIYSPELLATQLEFINALKWAERQTGAAQLSEDSRGDHEEMAAPVETSSELRRMLMEDAAETIEAARQRLRLWDMSDEQISEVEETRIPFRTITLYSTSGGYITEKMAVVGMKVMPGEKLFDIADLSDLWVIADIYEYELPFIKIGQEAKITLSYVPDREFSSRIDYIYPTISGETRTARVRLSLSNPDGRIRAQMYTNVLINIDLGKRMTIPESALVDTGEQQVVYVDLGNGSFEPRAVQTGLRSGGYVEILKGLKEGETVSTAANFLIDSEAQLRGVKPLDTD